MSTNTSYILFIDSLVYHKDEVVKSLMLVTLPLYIYVYTVHVCEGIGKRP